MDNQIFTFITHHWSLSLALLGVLILVFINEHIMQKQGPRNLSPQAAVDAMNHEKAKVIDMRDIETFRKSHIVNAKNIPNATLDKLEKQKNTPFILVCARGLQSSALAVKLQKQGFTTAMVLTGGITAWKAAGLPLISTKKETKKTPKNKKQDK
ncbi:MAG: rhodanese-like domain-containing protein [Gammaproteobacteria bacterium]|nr:rhodanese-like domain-containing protein [Gammaproteobacteria bacterium]MCH9716744.1 rhodanese-like domain-containing protein [Gammaproteobacteria bacterium]MCH9764199.1 rhodanese-like domain-containing protein [Gammaproteobacteria bacterium]